MKNAWRFLFTFEDEEHGKKYVVFAHPDVESEEVFASAYDDAGNLLPVESDEEWAMIEEVILAFQEDEEKRVMNKNFWKQKKVFIPIGIVIALVCIIIGFMIYYNSSTAAVSDGKDPIVFVVESGESSEVVLNKLAEQDLIKNSFCCEAMYEI